MARKTRVRFLTRKGVSSAVVATSEGAFDIKKSFVFNETWQQFYKIMHTFTPNVLKRPFESELSF